MTLYYETRKPAYRLYWCAPTQRWRVNPCEHTKDMGCGWPQPKYRDVRDLRGPECAS